MPFGKFRGCPVPQLPEHYLWWLWENVSLREPLRSQVHAAIFGASVDESPASVAAGRIKQIYRTLAVKWHPDRGGTTEAMQAINDFYDALRQV